MVLQRVSKILCRKSGIAKETRDIFLLPSEKVMTERSKGKIFTVITSTYIKAQTIKKYKHQNQYFMQKNRGAIVEVYGLAKETNLQGMRVVRPLLDHTKKGLEDYCLDNKITFGVDETNFDLSYSS